MKTVRKGAEVRRVSDKEAELLVNNDGWKYTAKSVWKKARLTPQPEQKS